MLFCFSFIHQLSKDTLSYGNLICLYPNKRHVDIVPYLTPESILSMDEEFYKENTQPKFFYLSPDELWKWRVNALNFSTFKKNMSKISNNLM